MYNPRGHVIGRCRYATRLQAEKALAAGHGSRLSDTVMLAVQKVLEDEVGKRLNLKSAVPCCVDVGMFQKLESLPRDEIE